MICSFMYISRRKVVIKMKGWSLSSLPLELRLLNSDRSRYIEECQNGIVWISRKSGMICSEHMRAELERPVPNIFWEF